MGQYFELFNIDEALYTVKSYLGASQGGGKFGEWYFGKDGKILMDFLTVPKVKLPEDPLEGQYFTSVNCSGIHTLPCELQQQIFDELDDMSDVFCFSLTSRYMWTVGIRTLRRLYVTCALRGAGAWAGHRLIIAGDYSGECPTGVFTDSDLAILANVDCNEDDDEGFYGPLQRLASDITTDYMGNSASFKLNARLNERVDQWRHWCDTPPWMDKFLTWTQPARRNSLEFPIDPVLRNLTKKEYVRADALALPRGYYVHYNRNPVTLGHAVMSRIVWSADPSVAIALSDEFTNKLVHGVWTGCRFDIVGFAEWTERDGWNDVSTEVKEDLMYMAVQEGAIIAYDPDKRAESNSDEGDGSQ